MKRIAILTLAALISLGVLGVSAYAWKGSGFGGYGGVCPTYGYLDSEKLQKFYNDTLPLRQKQLQLRGQLLQLYSTPNPDWNAIAKIQQEMIQLRTEIQKRAYESGLNFGGRVSGRGFGKKML